MKKNNTLAKNARRMAIAAMLSAPALAFAVPAKPGIHTIVTPDGLELRLEKRGGPFAHATFTDDGILLSQLEDGTYVYAQINAEGLPCPSAMVAHAPEHRTSEEKKFVSLISNAEMLQALQLRDEKVSLAMSGSRYAPSAVMQRARAKNPGLCKTSMPVNTGSPKCLVLLVEFNDERFRTPDAYNYFNNAITQPGFNSGKWTGSVIDYFTDNSMGKYTPQFEVYGPVTLERNMSYYGGNDSYGNDKRAHTMVTDACSILDETSDINFADYDNDGDGVVDNIFVFFAGFGEANSFNRPNTIWPHSHDLTQADPRNKYIFDGVQLDHYACTNEVNEIKQGSDKFETEGIGTFVHEFSHVLGLPDLYETSYNTGAFTPGYYSILDYGPYNNDGHTPPNYGAYERYALGWMEPEELVYTKETTLRPIADTNHAFVINTPRENEYYLLENRRKEGWDTYIPNEGMLVWHIDFSPSIFEANIVNNDPSHQYVDLIEADNRKDAGSREGDVFPGTSNVTSLGFNTTPKLASWAGINLFRELTNIHHDDRKIIFNCENTDPNYVGVSETLGENGKLSFSAGMLTSSYTDASEVYDTLGRKVATVAGGASVILPSGLYVVATPDGAMKIRM